MTAELEPLDRAQPGRGIGMALRSVFEVLYEADEPLDIETIATRTKDRVGSAVRSHARRARLRQRERSCRGNFGIARTKVTVDTAWRPWLTTVVDQAVRRDMLIREDGRYRPNPLKAPYVLDVDGRRRRFTREQWQVLNAEERIAGELAMLPAQLRDLLPAEKADVDELIVMALRRWAKKPTRLMPRQLRQTLDFASTREARGLVLRKLIDHGYPP